MDVIRPTINQPGVSQLAKSRGSENRNCILSPVATVTIRSQFNKGTHGTLCAASLTYL